MLSPKEGKLLETKLRVCQREAISKIGDYLSRSLSGKSMLVCLPTGAGKTGVIAAVCQARPAGATLVLSPRRAVCDQLGDQVRGKFFQDRGVEVAALNPVGVVGSKIEKGSIIIDTFQKIVLMNETSREEFLSQFDLVIVDEGHSEPAPTWGRIVRSMACRKVIVTATPYRNDLFQFDIGEVNYCFTLKRAIHAGDVLEPEFTSATTDSLIDDAQQWLEDNPSLKCIIKCENFSDVIGHLRKFNEHGIRALAFHDQFGCNVEQGGMVHVPRDVATRAERVLIHQHKLDEGVDIPNAKLLVLTYAVSNGRELVQATGRIVRKSNGLPKVWDCAEGSNQALWENYRKFDSYISDDESWQLFLNSLDSATLIDAYLAAFPKMSYFGQTFRSTFDLESFDPEKQLKLPLASFCFMEVEDAFAMPSFLDALLWEMRGRGELAKLCPSAFDLNVIVSITFDNSNFLRDEVFFQPRIEVIVAKKVGARLAIFDSRSVDHSSRKELNTGRPIDVTSMLKLASRDQGRRTRETHARSVGTTRRRPEGVSQRGRDLEGVIVTQTNASYALSIAKIDNLDAANKRTTSYYLGVGSGRVLTRNFATFHSIVSRTGLMR